jgi:nucleotide-binding universal stress UspA family protein
MIVMSTHGRSGLNRWLFGSVTFKVLSGACCPVVVIPNRSKGREPVGADAEAAVP